MIQDIAIAALILLSLLAALECGFRYGRRSATSTEAGPIGHLGAIQGAVLGLLALLLGFSFAGAAARFMERQDLIVRESNAIATAFRRSDLFDEPERSELRAALSQYVKHRVGLSARLRYGLEFEDVATIEHLRDQMWSSARDGAMKKPAVMMAVLLPVNDVLDLHATRVAAGRKHLPGLVLGLLVASSLLSMAMIGFGCGLGRRRAWMMTGPLALVVGVALWTTIDLDHPRIGLIRLSDEPLNALRLTAAEQTSSGPSVQPGRSDPFKTAAR